MRGYIYGTLGILLGIAIFALSCGVLAHLDPSSDLDFWEGTAAALAFIGLFAGPLLALGSFYLTVEEEWPV